MVAKRQFWLIGICIAVAVGLWLIHFSNLVISNNFQRSDSTFENPIDLFVWELPRLVTWLLSIVAILKIEGAVPFSIRRILKSISIHGLLGAGFFLGAKMVYSLMRAPFIESPISDHILETYKLVSGTDLVDCLFYGTIVLLGFTARSIEIEKTSTLEAGRLENRMAELEAQFAKAQLENLRMQLHPNFFFNTLNSISALVRTSQLDEAQLVLNELSYLLRKAFHTSSDQLVLLSEEIEIVEKYLAIESIRFGDRLQVEVGIPENLRNHLIPALILQPLIENAIRHGIATWEDSGKISVLAKTSNNSLEVTIRNNGKLNLESREGLGIPNTLSRLKTLFGDQSGFSLREVESDLVEAKVRLPVKTQNSEPAP